MRLSATRHGAFLSRHGFKNTLFATRAMHLRRVHVRVFPYMARAFLRQEIEIEIEIETEKEREREMWRCVGSWVRKTCLSPVHPYALSLCPDRPVRVQSERYSQSRRFPEIGQGCKVPILRLLLLVLLFTF